MRERSRLEAWLDDRFERLAVENGACPLATPATIEGEVLARGGHFESFPGLAIRADAGDRYHAPAACYHVYAMLRGARLEADQLLTLAAPCARHESGADVEPGRFSHFRMREVVFVGAPGWVAQQRDEWMQRAATFAESLGLTASMDAATDTFFGDPGRGRRLMQQLKALKYELRVNIGAPGPLALASFNLHETFFTSRFDVALADGSAAASGCAAFGIERWALAHGAQRQHAGF
jgi:seryl-tRNA synthetase